MLNHTGLLNAARWVTRMYFSSALNASASSSSTKYPPSMPQRVMVSTTRSTTWRNDDSRSGVPSVPRKYFWATMLVALTDHATGNSTSTLLERDSAVLPVADPSVTALPHDLVVRVDPWRGEQPSKTDGHSLGRQ